MALRPLLLALFLAFSTQAHADEPVCMKAVLAGSLGHQTLTLRVAHTFATIQQGLMGITHLPPEFGMLFVFEQARPWTFWMHNTPTALDIIPLDDEGRVIEVLEGVPNSTTHLTPSRPIRRVLEVQAGTVERLGAQAPNGALVVYDGAPCPLSKG